MPTRILNNQEPDRHDTSQRPGLSVAALTNARKPGFSAFIFSDEKALTGNSADYKYAAAEDLGRTGLLARTEGIFFGPPMGRGSDCTTMVVVAEVNNDAGRQALLGPVMGLVARF